MVFVRINQTFRLNFAPAPKRIPVTEIITAVENGLRNTNQTEVQLGRTRIVGCLNKARPPPTNLNPAEHKPIKLLREDDSIIIAMADKGNVMVVMNSEDYDGKIRSLLADTVTYKRLVKDPTLAQERRMNALLLSLMRSGAIPESLYQRLRSSAGKVPLLYGLPKVHKPGTPSGQLCHSSTPHLCLYLVPPWSVSLRHM